MLNPEYRAFRWAVDKLLAKLEEHKANKSKSDSSNNNNQMKLSADRCKKRMRQK